MACGMTECCFLLCKAQGCNQKGLRIRQRPLEAVVPEPVLVQQFLVSCPVLFLASVCLETAYLVVQLLCFVNHKVCPQVGSRDQLVFSRQHYLMYFAIQSYRLLFVAVLGDAPQG